MQIFLTWAKKKHFLKLLSLYYSGIGLVYVCHLNAIEILSTLYFKITTPLNEKVLCSPPHCKPSRISLTAVTEWRDV